MVLAAVPNDYNMTTEIVTPCEKQATNRQLCLVEPLSKPDSAMQPATKVSP